MEVATAPFAQRNAVATLATMTGLAMFHDGMRILHTKTP